MKSSLSVALSTAALVAAGLTAPLAATAATAAEGLLAVKSPHSATTTMNRLEAIVKERGLTVFVHVDHAAGAAKVGNA